jgi:hypothetical protein
MWKKTSCAITYTCTGGRQQNCVYLWKHSIYSRNWTWMIFGLSLTKFKIVIKIINLRYSSLICKLSNNLFINKPSSILSDEGLGAQKTHNIWHWISVFHQNVSFLSIIWSNPVEMCIILFKTDDHIVIQSCFCIS